MGSGLVPMVPMVRLSATYTQCAAAQQLKKASDCIGCFTDVLANPD